MHIQKCDPVNSKEIKYDGLASLSFFYFGRAPAAKTAGSGASGVPYSRTPAAFLDTASLPSAPSRGTRVNLSPPRAVARANKVEPLSGIRVNLTP